ncbi:MAG: hypothetical protein COT17_07480 [Elusimicrobia bacterium CG08_land_8_20_14_0_20_51_18]|nr:MAG: hypothetical protein COT17_07480 [Elusimicrobia bacterium CG08_land_8_20_14_0_20_51_18]
MKLFNRFLTIIFSIGFIPIIPVFAFLFYYQSVGKADILRFHENMARMSAGMAEENFYQLSKRMDSLDLARITYADGKRFIGYSIEKNPEFLFLALLDPAGRQKERDGIIPLKRLFSYIDISGEEYFRRIKIQKTPIIGDFKLVANIPAALIIYPLRTGEMIYAIVDLRDFFRQIYAQKIGGGSVYFANSAGAIFSFDNFAPAINSRKLAGLFSSGSGRLDAVSDSRGEYIGAFSRILDMDLFAVTLQGRAQAFKSVNLMTSLVVFFIFSILTIFYFVALISAGNISGPINDLIEGAERISRGDFKAPVSEKNTIKEISRLVKTFNSMMREISEYHSVNLEKVMDEKEKLDLLMGVISDSIILAEFTGVPVYLNPVASEFLMAGGEDIRSERMRLKISEIVKINAKSGGKGLSFPWAKGRYYDVTVKTLKPLRSVPLVFIVVRDVTVELNIQKMKEDFFHSIAHDLRSPILNMQGYIRLLQLSGGLSPEKKKEYVEGLKEESDRIFVMLENILDMSRLESGAVKLNLKEAELGGFLEKTMARFEYLFREKEIKYEVIKPAAGGKFIADYELLERAVSNLISNACKFTDKNGIIKLKAEILAGGEAVIEVSDTGRGISRDKLGLIFDKFRSYDKNGFGLGLSIAKAVAELHKGSIRAESEEGKGSSFFIKLRGAYGK